MNIKNLILFVSLLLPTMAMSQATFVENGITYVEDLSDPSKLAVIVVAKKSPMVMEGVSAYEGDIVVPSKVEHDLDTYMLTGIAQGAFYSANIESLEIGEGPTKIMSGTLYSETLTKLVLPNSIKTIEGVFTLALEEVKFGNSLTSIKTWSMGGNIESIEFPKSLKKLEGVSIISMTGDYNLKHISFGDEMDYIKTCFSNYPGAELEIPKCKSIEASFGQLDALNKLTLTEGIQRIKASFGSIEKLESLLIPSSCKIVDQSFGNLSNLQQLEIKNGVETITNSFYNTKQLKHLTIPKSVKSIDNSFIDLSNVEELTIEDGVETINKSVNRAKMVKKFTLPKSVKAIKGSFDSMDNLEELHLEITEPIDMGYSFSSNNLKSVYVKWTTPPATPKFISKSAWKGFTLHVPAGMANSYIEAWNLQKGVDAGKIIVVEN